MIALIAAVLMVVFHIFNQEQALEFIDFNTVGLLIGMMIIVKF